MNKLLKKSLLAVVALTSLSGSAIAANTDWSTFQSDVYNGGTVSLTQSLQAESDNGSIITSAVNTVINGNGYSLNSGFTGNSVIVSGAGSGLTLELNNLTVQNGSSIYGGGVDNTSGTTLKVSNATFISNASLAGPSSSGGGAIANRGSVDASGVVTQSILNVVDSTFSGNTSQYFAGAIYNANGIADIRGSILDADTGLSTTKFVGNVSGTRGGAMYNGTNASLNVSGVYFSDNEASHGGAIANTGLSASTATGSTVLTVDSSRFYNNRASQFGGAIYTYSKEDNTITNATFDTNSAAGGAGGAIYNDGKHSPSEIDGKLIVRDSNFYSNTSATEGGAIGNVGELTVSGSNFKGNYANSGAAIANVYNPVLGSAANVTVKNSVFDGNGENANTRAVSEFGGAIYNQNIFSVEGSSFKNNKAKNGGAVYNQKLITLKDSSFLNNTVDETGGKGGAIYGTTDSTTNVIAENSNVFLGDGNATDKTTTDSIYLENNAILNLSAKGGEDKEKGNIIVNSEITGSSSVNKAQINVNQDAAYQGQVSVNSNVSNANISLYNGTLHFSNDKYLNSSDTLNLNGTLNPNTNTYPTLSLLNGVVTPFQMGELNINGTTNLALDVDLANQTMDGIDSSSVVNYTSGALNVNSLKSITDNTNPDVAVMFTDHDAITGNGVVTSNGLGIVEGPIHKYSVMQKYEDGTGIDGSGNPIARGEYFVFNKVSNSSSILAGPVAAQVGGFLLMDNIYKQAFSNFDLTIAMTPEERQAIINNYRERNYFIPASERTGSLSPRLIPEERKGVWFRPYNNYEHVSLKRGPRVSNVTYGALIGGDSELAELRGGWQGFYSSYIAYNGAHQAFDGISMWQNGGTVGVSGAVFKGNFFTAGTANVGASAAHANTFFGSENINLLMTGAALKSGYNWSLKNNRFIIQPSFMTSYTFVNTFDYTSASGYNVESDPLHAIEIIPGLKFIANTKNGWQPYIGVNMVWNIIDQTKFYVQDAILDRLAVKPYIEYGVGVQKRKGERCTGFGQAMIRNGGREGVAFTLGMRWAVGK